MDFTPIQLLSVTYSGGEWHEQAFRDWWMYLWGRYYYYTLYACVEGEGCAQQMEGWWASCQVEETYFQWKGVSNCAYEKTVASVAFPNGALEFLLME